MNGQELLAILALNANRNPVLDATILANLEPSKDYELFWLNPGDGEKQYSFRVYGPEKPSENWLFYLHTERDAQRWVSCSVPIPTVKSGDKEFVSAAIAKAIEQMQGCKL